MYVNFSDGSGNGSCLGVNGGYDGYYDFGEWGYTGDCYDDDGNDSTCKK